VSLRQYCSICKACDYREHHRKIAEQVRNSAYHIIDYKGSTYYGIGLSLVRITETILRNEHSILTVSSFLDGQYGIKDVCISVPCVVGDRGIEMIVDTELAEDELKALRASAQTIRKVLEQIKGK